MEAEPTGWRAAIARFLASRSEVEAAEERTEVRRTGTVPVADLADRTRVQVSGVLRSVTLRPGSQVPALEADLFDGSGVLRIVWLGRRRIRGIGPGRRLRAAGLVSLTADGPVMYNPRYELSPNPASEES